RAIKIVIDGGGHADDRKPAAGERVRAGLAAVSADDDQGIAAGGFEPIERGALAVLRAELFRAGTAQDGAAALHGFADVAAAERLKLAGDQARVTVAHA